MNFVAVSAPIMVLVFSAPQAFAAHALIPTSATIHTSVSGQAGSDALHTSVSGQAGSDALHTSLVQNNPANKVQDNPASIVHLGSGAFGTQSVGEAVRPMDLDNDDDDRLSHRLVQ